MTKQNLKERFPPATPFPRKFIFFFLTLTSLLGYEANQVTSQELKALQIIDKKIYDLSTKTIKYEFERVASFIFFNLAFDVKYSRLKISSSASAKVNSNDTTRDDGTTSTDRNNFSVGVTLTYPLFDRKESNDRKKQIIDTKKKIMADVRSYFKLKAELDDLKVERLILEQIEIRSKARKLDGVGSFNDWLIVLKNIKKTNLQIASKYFEIIEKEQLLLNYVRASRSITLKEML